MFKNKKIVKEIQSYINALIESKLSVLRPILSPRTLPEQVVKVVEYLQKQESYKNTAYENAIKESTKYLAEIEQLKRDKAEALQTISNHASKRIEMQGEIDECRETIASLQADLIRSEQELTELKVKPTRGEMELPPCGTKSVEVPEGVAETEHVKPQHHRQPYKRKNRDGRL